MTHFTANTINRRRNTYRSYKVSEDTEEEIDADVEFMLSEIRATGILTPDMHGGIRKGIRIASHSNFVITHENPATRIVHTPMLDKDEVPIK